MLASQLIQIPFAEGLDQKTDQRHLPAGKLRAATNIRFAKNNAVEKRRGVVYEATVANAVRLATHHDEVVALDTSGALHLWTTAGDAFSDKGDGLSVVTTRQGVGAGGNFIINPDIAGNDDAYLVVWVGSFGTGTQQTWMSVIDRASGAERSAELLASGVVSPRVCVLTNGSFVVAWCDGTDIYAQLVNANYTLNGSATVVVSDARSETHLEVHAYGTQWLLLNEHGALGNKPVLRLLTGTTVNNTLQINEGFSGSNKRGFGISAVVGENIWCSWILNASPDEAWVSCVNPSTFLERSGFPFMLFDSGALLWATAPKRISSSTCVVGITGNTVIGVSSGDAQFSAFPVVNQSGAVVGNASVANRTTDWTAMASEPFVDAAGRVLAWLTVFPAGTDVSLSRDPTSFCLCDVGATDTATSDLQAKPASGLNAARFAYAENYASMGPSSVDTSGTTHASLGIIKKSNDGRVALSMLQADTSSADTYGPAEVGESLHYAPGGVFDGQMPTEHGFLYAPTNFYVAMSGLADGELSAGEYFWVINYKFTDRNGNVTRSAFSDPVGETAAADDTATLTVPSLCLTRRHAEAVGQEVEIEVWRTLVDGTEEGPFFQWAPGNGYQNGTIWRNTPGTATRTITDSVADSFIETNAVYTPGAALPNVSPPAYTNPVLYRERLCVLGDDRRTWYLSKAYVEGEATSFSDQFTIQWSDPDPVIAGYVMDGNLVAWTEHGIFINSFVGPGDAGGASDIQPWTRVQSDIGCTDPRSIVGFQDGVFFRSRAGLYVLTRGLEVVFLGQPVEDLLVTYPTVTSALVHPSENIIVFTAENDTQGVRVVYDYRIKQWSRDEVGGTSEEDTGARVVSQVVAQGVVWSALSTGVVARESNDDDAAAYKDQATSGAATWQYKRVETANIKLAGLQGFQRVRRMALMGSRYTSHDLVVSYANDDSDTYHDTTVWKAYQLDGLGPEQVQDHLSRQKCSSVRVRIVDGPPTGGSAGTGRGCSLTGIAFEIGVKKKANRVAEAQKG